MSTQNKEIKAVHIADLENLLKKYGQLLDFKNGNIKCHICLNVISPSNAGSLKLVHENLVFTCNKLSCYDQIVKNTMS